MRNINKAVISKRYSQHERRILNKINNISRVAKMIEFNPNINEVNDYSDDTVFMFDIDNENDYTIGEVQLTLKQAERFCKVFPQYKLIRKG